MPRPIASRSSASGVKPYTLRPSIESEAPASNSLSSGLPRLQSKQGPRGARERVQEAASRASPADSRVEVDKIDRELQSLAMFGVYRAEVNLSASTVVFPRDVLARSKFRGALGKAVTPHQWKVYGEWHPRKYSELDLETRCRLYPGRAAGPSDNLFAFLFLPTPVSDLFTSILDGAIAKRLGSSAQAGQ